MIGRSIAYLLFISIAMATQGQEPRTIRAQIHGVSNDTVYLANYYGSRLYYADTAVANAKGQCTFSKPRGLYAGVYAVVVPGPKYFEIVVNEPEIDITTDVKDLTGDLIVKKSEENRVFYEYIRFLNQTREESEVLKKKMETTEDPIRKAELKTQLQGTDEKVKAYQQKMIEQAPERFVSKLVRMSMTVDLEQLMKPDGTLDTIASYHQYRDHFWDNVDLHDERIVRSPIFHNKLEEYVKKAMPQLPDSINKLTDELIARTKGDDEVFKYIVHYVTYNYETSDIMGMDAVFAHMGRTYYCDGPKKASRAFWMSAEKKEKMCERVSKLEPLLIGKKAPYLKLTDTTEQNWVSFYDLKADYTIIVFWDPNCGHCKKELPVLISAYRDTLKPMNVEVYAVAKAVEDKTFSDWKKFIRENDLDWINIGLTVNVYKDAKANPHKYIPEFTTLESLNYGDTYDVFSTPKVIIVDSKQIIVGKSLAANQIVDFIQRLKRQKEKLAGHP